MGTGGSRHGSLKTTRYERPEKVPMMFFRKVTLHRVTCVTFQVLLADGSRPRNKLEYADEALFYAEEVRFYSTAAIRITVPQSLRTRSDCDARAEQILTQMRTKQDDEQVRSLGSNWQRIVSKIDLNSLVRVEKC